MYTLQYHQTPQASSPVRKLFTIFLYGIVTVLLLCATGFTYLHMRGIKPLSIQSGSMAPVIRKGDLVIVNPVSVAALQPGDVVTFINPANKQQTITHRIVSIDPATRLIRTKGDANVAADKAFNPKLIVGRVDYIVPVAGSAIDMVRHPVGLAIIIYIPTLLVIGAEMNRLARHYKSQKRYRILGRTHLPHGSHSQAAFKAAGVVMMIGVVLGVAYPAYAALSSSSQLLGNRISSAPIPASYQVCVFPNTSTLLSYALIDVLYPEQPDPPIMLDEPIIPGTYKITAVSADNHVVHPNAPTQPNERWFAQLYGKNLSEPIHATGVTDDIPDGIDQTVTVIDGAATFTESVTAIRYVHNAYLTGLEKAQFGYRRFDELSEPEKRLVIWNSVHPGCLTFERIQPLLPAAITE